MATTTRTATRTLAGVRTLGVVLALVSAGIHVFWGAPRAILYLQAGVFSDPRPFLFVASGGLIMTGAVALAADYRRRALYALGIAFLLAYSLGYVAWHLGGHGGFLPGMTALWHQEPSVSVLLDHLTDPLDAVSMASQLGGIACFAYLLRVDD